MLRTMGTTQRIPIAEQPHHQRLRGRTQIAQEKELTYQSINEWPKGRAVIT